MDHRADLPEMGRTARLLAEDRADWQKNFPQLEKAYRIALGKANPDQPVGLAQ